MHCTCWGVEGQIAAHTVCPGVFFFLWGGGGREMVLQRIPPVRITPVRRLFEYVCNL